MGYYTQYSLRLLANEIAESELSALITRDSRAVEALDATGEARGWVRWYDHEESLREWSGQHPDALFCLHAEGEDSSGIWDKYFFAGRLVRTETYGGLRRFGLDELLFGSGELIDFGGD